MSRLSSRWTAWTRSIGIQLAVSRPGSSGVTYYSESSLGSALIDRRISSVSSPNDMKLARDRTTTMVISYKREMRA